MTKRKYSLGCFNIRECFASQDEIENLRNHSYHGLRKLIWKATQKLVPPDKRTVIQERKVGPFNKNIFRISGSIYLEGYWQSEKYFIEISDIIRKEFSLTKNILSAMSKGTENLAQKISSMKSVSVHIRRGDYVNEAKTTKMHGFCTSDYYNKAIEVLSSKIINPHFFIFSDDVEWVEKSFFQTYPITNVSRITEVDPIQDLYLMSLCQNHIIANSTFSWWGAWLSGNQKKIVCAPSKWFHDKNINTQDLLPGAWIKI